MKPAGKGRGGKRQGAGGVAKTVGKHVGVSVRFDRDEVAILDLCCALRPRGSRSRSDAIREAVRRVYGSGQWTGDPTGPLGRERRRGGNRWATCGADGWYVSEAEGHPPALGPETGAEGEAAADVVLRARGWAP